MLENIGIDCRILDSPLARDGQNVGFGVRIEVESCAEISRILRQNWQLLEELLKEHLVIDVVGRNTSVDFTPARSGILNDFSDVPISMPFHLDLIERSRATDPSSWKLEVSSFYQMPVEYGRNASTLFAQPHDVADEIESVVTEKSNPATFLYRLRRSETDSAIKKVMNWRSIEQTFGSNFGFRSCNDLILERMLPRSVRIDWSNTEYCKGGRLVYFWNGSSYYNPVPRVVHTRYGLPEDCSNGVLFTN